MTLLRRVDVDQRLVDVRITTGRITAVSEQPLTPTGDEEVVDGDGGALLPGLHDHHLHLLAVASAAQSIDVSAGLDALRAAPEGGWVRAVGLAEPEVDAAALDRFISHRPVRVQHRSGALWVLNTRALARLDAETPPEGMELDATGRPNGRLWRLDDWLAERISPLPDAPDLAAVGRQLLEVGITAVTDASPTLSDEATTLFAASGLPQRVQCLAERPPAGCTVGPRKIVLSDHALPTFDELCDRVLEARAQDRAVAVHCVTRASLVLLLAVLEVVGHRDGDRVEHGAIVDAETAMRLARRRIAVVTQPGFIADRGDDYLREVDRDDLPLLYPYASLRAAGVTVVPSSDAPYGPIDPWQVMRAARDRRSERGRSVAGHEAVDVATVLDGYLRPLEDLHAPARRVQVGAPADLVLLGAALHEVLTDPSADLVRRTWTTGTPHPRPGARPARQRS